MKQVYTCNEELKLREFPATQRGLGVTVYGPYPHAGIGGEAYDVEYQRLEIDAAGFGQPTAAANVRAVVIEDIDAILSDLDAKLLELHKHRQRLQEERARLVNYPGYGPQVQGVGQMPLFGGQP